MDSAAPEPVGARLVSRVPGRARLRVGERRGETALFATLTQTIGGWSDVVRVTTNPRTGSVLIEHEGPLDPILARLAETGLLRIDKAGRRPAAGAAVRDLRLGFAWLDLEMRRLTGREVDLSAGIILALTLLALFQGLRGQILPPAITIAWYAAMLARVYGDRDRD